MGRKRTMILEQEELKEYLQQGEILLENGNYSQAVVYADKILEADEMNLQAYVLKGASLAKAEKYDEAEECFRRAILVDKKSEMAHYHMGSVLLLKGDTIQGIEEYRKAIELGYEYWDIYFNLGLAYEDREDYDIAIREYSRAIKLDSLNPLAYIRKGLIYMQQSRYEEALRVWDELRKMCPNSFEGYHYGAQVYTILEEYDKADSLLKGAEERFTEDADILLDRLRVLVAKGDVDTALQEVEKAEKMINDSMRKKELALEKAKLYGVQDKMPECIQMLESVLQESENETLDAEIRYLLINAYKLQKDFEKIEKHAEELLKYDMSNPYALGAKYFQAEAMSWKNAECKQKVYKDAIRFYRKLAVDNPERIESYIFRAICHREIGEYEKALEMIDYVMALQTTGKLWFIKSNILKEMGKEEEAKAAFAKAEELGEDMSLWKE